jgi:hypothetical protein
MTNARTGEQRGEQVALIYFGIRQESSGVDRSLSTSSRFSSP